MNKRFEHWKKATHKNRTDAKAAIAPPPDMIAKKNGVTSAHSAATTNGGLATMQAEEEKKEVSQADDPLDHENYTDI